MGRDKRFGNDGFDRRFHRSPFGTGFGFFVGSGFIDPLPSPQPVFVPYAVPNYYPVRVYPGPTRYRSEPSEPMPPPNPANSKTLIIGAGHDGGGGVMRIQQLGDSAVRLTWLGSVRPVSEARFFLADSLRRSFRSRAVDESSPSVVFRMADLPIVIAYAGLTVIYANGATVTTLVPFERK